MIIKALNSTSRYLDGLFNIDNPYFEGMVNPIYPPELQLNKANTSDSLDLHLYILGDFENASPRLNPQYILDRNQFRHTLQCIIKVYQFSVYPKNSWKLNDM